MISISDYYRVNVAVADGKDWKGDTKYVHYFWISIDRIYPEEEVKKKVALIKEKFPYPEYHVTTTLEKHRGEILDW